VSWVHYAYPGRLHSTPLPQRGREGVAPAGARDAARIPGPRHGERPHTDGTPGHRRRLL